MKNFYFNLLASVSLVSAMALSSSLKAGDTEKREEETITTVSVQLKQVGAAQEAAPQAASFKNLPPHVFALIAENSDVRSLASLIHTESGVIDRAIEGGYNPQLSPKIKVEKSWETADEFIDSFKKQFQGSLNVEGLLEACGSFEGKPLKYVLFMMGHAWKKFNLDLTLENIS